MSVLSAIRPLMVCSALLAFGHVASAQTKVGVINLQKAVLESAEIKAASAAMEAKYGQAQRAWVLDRGMVSEDNLEFLRDHGGQYIVGTPKAMLPHFECALLDGEA